MTARNRISRSRYRTAAKDNGATVSEEFAATMTRQAAEERFEPLARLVDLLALAEGEAGDPGAGVRDQGDEALGLERLERLANGHAARAEALRDDLLSEP